MAKIQFIGRLMPPAMKFQAKLGDIVWKWEAENVEFKIKVRIGGSVVNAECEMDRYEPSFFIEIYKRLTDVIDSFINLIAFSTGWALSVAIDIFIDQDGNPSEILPQDPSLATLCTAFNTTPEKAAELEFVAQLVCTNPALFRALNDLVDSIRVPHVSIVNCGRVVDSLRRLIVPVSSGNSGRDWAAMHTALNVSRAYQEFISQQSTGPRHADPTFIPGSVTGDVVRRTWVLMNRYFEYCKRGRAPLTDPEFPLLS